MTVTGPPQATDSSALVLHLRTVHFATLGLCFVLLAAALSPKPKLADEALRQIRLIAEAAENWEVGWLAAHVAESLSTFPSEFPPRISSDSIPLRLIPITRPYRLLRPQQLLPFAPQRTGMQEALQGLREHAIAQERRSRRAWSESDYLQLELAKPTTLGVFSALWDSLRLITLDVPEMVVSKAVVFQTTPDRELNRDRLLRIVDLTDQYLDTLNPYPGFRALSTEETEWWVHTLGLRITRPESPMHAIGHFHGGPTDSEYLYFEVPASTRVYEINGQEVWNAVFHQEWRGGTFSQTFPELGQVNRSMSLDGLPFFTIDVMLQDEVARSAGRLQVFGTSVPLSFIARWGAILLIVTQAYLLMHLTATSRRLRYADPGTQVPWVGVYTDFWAQFFTLASAVGLPVFVVGFLSVRQAMSDPAAVNWAVFAVLLLFSGFLAWCSLKRIRKIWRCVPLGQVDTQAGTPR